MNRILRRSPWWKGVALLALVSVMSGAWLTVVHGGLVEGVACPAESGLATAHGGSTVDHDHGAIAHHDCNICRGLRSLRSMTGDASPMLGAIVPSGFVHPDSIAREGHLVLVRVPARSPPA
jgi:hypothetical protein